jgi:hypothetical protein
MRRTLFFELYFDRSVEEVIPRNLTLAFFGGELRIVVAFKELWIAEDYSHGKLIHRWLPHVYFHIGIGLDCLRYRLVPPHFHRIDLGD